MFKLRKGLLGLCMLLGCLVNAQNSKDSLSSVRGQLYSVHREPIIGAVVWLNDRAYVTETNIDGVFEIDSLPANTYRLHIELDSYNSIDTTIKAGNSGFSVVLHENTDIHKIKEVVIFGKSDAQLIEETGFMVNSIDLKPMQNLNVDLNRILNQTTGVRIREEGGMGSNFNFGLNGFTSNQVKFFIDGMPMDNYGTSLTLNNIPVNLVSRMDVYKGVVPIFLGSDALGGAVNVVTNQTLRNYVDVSYSFGSFNTHRAAAIARYTHAKTGFTVNTKGIYNYSDNDYFVDIQLAKNGESLKDYTKVRRFHDAYQSQTVELELGVVDKKYADRLLFGVIASGNHKEVQHGYNLSKVSGAVYTTDKVLIPTFKFSKKNLFVRGLQASVFANYNCREALNADTGKYLYTWAGRDVVNPYPRSGELSWDKTLFRFNDRSATAVGNLTYEFNKAHTLLFNNTFTNYIRQGEDPLSYEEVPFAQPNKLMKNITGLAYDANLLNDKLKTSVFTKIFVMQAKTYAEDEGDSKQLVEINKAYVMNGYGVAGSYMARKWLLLKASYENTARLPEASEMFGNGLLLKSNLALRPEKSQNFNIGTNMSFTMKRHSLAFELGYLYRLPKDLIRLAPLATQANYENLGLSRISCIEAGVKYNYHKVFFLELNGTYQDFVNTDKINPKDGSINSLYLDKLPNIPFLFSNGTLGFQFKNVFVKNSKLALNWSSNFVEAFYWKWPSQGNPEDKFDIPRQLYHSMSVSYSMRDDRYNVSLACTNLTDAKVYDNFNLQKPGRAFSIKLRYFISK